MEKKNGEKISQRVDWTLLLVPLLLILVLCFCFARWPGRSMDITDLVRGWIGDKLGFCYILLGCACVAATMYMAFSRYGNILLGDTAKPEYGNFQWGSMIFTATMGADILFYSCIEWALYGVEPYVQQKSDSYIWALTYPLLHWGPTVWSFYIVLAVSFGFMIHVRHRTRQKFSEACRPVLGKQVDGAVGKLMDLLCVFAIIGGAATFLSVSTPLTAGAIAKVFGFHGGTLLTMIVLILIAVLYTVPVLRGMKSISHVATFCTYMFLALIAWVFLAGGEARFIIETGIQSLGNLFQNFIHLNTYMDPMRENGFPQTWTIFYWAYWLVWAVATPFFIGMISKGRTVKNVVLGGYAWALAGTFMSFVVLEGYASAQQLRHGLDITGEVAAGTALHEVILRIFDTLPLPAIGLIFLAVSMMYFYSTTLDAAALVVASYSYKRLEEGELPDKRVRAWWAFLLILLPMVLINSNNSITRLQSVTIITALPMVLIVSLIVISFFKDAGHYLDAEK